MKHSTLEINLQDLKDKKINELDIMFEDELKKINSGFEEEKSKLEQAINTKFEIYSKNYSLNNINEAKKEANLIQLKAITNAKKKLELQLYVHFQDYFVDIIKNLIPHVETTLGISSDMIELQVSKGLKDSFKTINVFQKIIENISLTKTEVVFFYNNELVRFNLKEEIKNFVEFEVGGLK